MTEPEHDAGGLGDVKLHLVDSIDEVLKLKTWLGERRPVHALGIDTETSGFSLRNDKIRMFQVGDGAAGWAIPWELWNGLARDIVKVWDGRWIFHNSPFDLKFLAKEGVHISIGRVDDTMPMARINEPLYSMALKTQAARHVDPAAGGLQAELHGTKWTWATVPIDYGPYWTYSALDPVLTYKLFEHHYPIVQQYAPDAYDLEMAVMGIALGMETYGAHVDRALAQTSYTAFMDYCDQVEQWCLEHYNVKPGSNLGVIAILEEAGFTFSKTTKGGGVALDAEVLGDIDHPLARNVLQRRKLQKLASTYLQYYIENADENDLIHPSINTLGAKTSRMSIRDPNAQNLPRHGTSKAGDVVRQCWTTRYDDGALIMCDFSQIEARLLAHYANDQGMIGAFSQGDFFVNLAQQVFNDPTITKKDPRRQIIKSYTYGLLYGAGIKKLAQTAGIPENDVRTLTNAWNRTYPGVRAFQNETQRIAQNNDVLHGEPFVRSPFTGRKYVSDRGKEYALVNYLTQGGAAEIMKMKIAACAAAGLDKWMVIPVHDEIILDVPGEHVREAAQIVSSIMNDDSFLRVPITAEVSYGRSWGDKRDWPSKDVDDAKTDFWLDSTAEKV